MSKNLASEQLHNPLDTFRPLDMAYLRKQQDLGRSSVGVVAAIFDQDDNILILTHNASTKTNAGDLAPLAETSQFRTTENELFITETATQTLARGLWEELKVVSDIPARISASQPAFERGLPAGNHTDKLAQAICPVIWCEDPEKLLAEFTPNIVIQKASFKSIDEVMHAPQLRVGTFDWLQGLVESDAYRARDLTDLVIHPGASFDETRMDITWPGLELS